MTVSIAPGSLELAPILTPPQPVVNLPALALWTLEKVPAGNRCTGVPS
jgi:hypothetical protein